METTANQPKRTSLTYKDLLEEYLHESEQNTAGDLLKARFQYYKSTWWEDNVPNVTKDEKKENEKDKDKDKEKEKEKKKKEQIKKFFEIIGKHLTQLLEDELYTVYSDVKVDEKVTNKDIIIMTVLLNKRDYTTLALKNDENCLYAALFASAMFKTLSKQADAEENMELGTSFSDNSKYFEALACNVIAEMNLRDREGSQKLLVQPDEDNQTVMKISVNNGLMKFMGTTACQTKLNRIWKEKMSIFTSKEMIITCMFLPFLIPCIKFASHSNNGLCNILKIQWFGKTDLSNCKISLPYAVFCFYHAPVTKFWTNLIAYFVMLCCFSFFVLTDLHPLTYGHLSLMEIIIFFWIFSMFVEEIRQIWHREQISLWYRIRSWWKNYWNKLDATMYSLYLLSIILRVSLSQENFLWARMAYSITLAVFVVRALHFFYEAKYTGPKIIMIGNMVTDIKFFIMIFLVVLVSFGIITQANLFPNSKPSWQLLKDVVYLPYWQMYGELFLETIEGQDHSSCTTDAELYRNGTLSRCPETNALVPLVLAVYMVFTNILLVNLLIAMLSDTFQRVQANSVLIWKFYRYSLVCEFYERPLLVPPLILVHHLYWIIQYFVRKRCCTCTKSSNAFVNTCPDEERERIDEIERNIMNECLNKWKDNSNPEIYRARSYYQMSGDDTDSDYVLKDIVEKCKQMDQRLVELEKIKPLLNKESYG